MVVFFVFMLPILTMGLIAEERSGKTLALLLTSPIRPIEIVIGKYIAGVVLMGIMLALTLIFPLLLEGFGSGSSDVLILDWNSIATGYLGMFLLGSGFVAIGLFASSLTESQIVAVVISFFITLMFIVIGIASKGQSETWAQIINYISATSHVEHFLRGIIRLQDVVYYLSMSFVGVFLSYRVVEAERWR
jgi:ABC-2 type transport system permease protein